MQSIFLMLMVAYFVVAVPVAIVLPWIFAQSLMRAPGALPEPPWHLPDPWLTSIAGTDTTAKVISATSPHAAR